MPKTVECADQVFCVRENGVETWRCIVAGKVYGDWRSRGEARSGMEIEQRRHEARIGRNATRKPYFFDNVE